MPVKEWFSPLLLNVTDYPAGVHNITPAKMGLSFVIFIMLPVFTHIAGIIKALLKRDFAVILFIIGILFFATEIILSAQNRLAIISRYTLFSVPIMLLLAAYGLSSIQKQDFKKVFTVAAAISVILVTVFSTFGPQHISRMETLNTVANHLNKYNLDNRDIVYVPFGGQFLSMYYTKKYSTWDFYQGEFRTFTQVNKKPITRENLREKLKYYFRLNNPDKIFENYFKENALNKLERGRYLVMVTSRRISLYPANVLSEITNHDNVYNKQSIWFMLSSKTSNDVILLSNKYLKKVDDVTDGVWRINVYKK
jgi:hypothetical protein